MKEMTKQQLQERQNAIMEQMDQMEIQWPLSMMHSVVRVLV